MSNVTGNTYGRAPLASKTKAGSAGKAAFGDKHYYDRKTARNPAYEHVQGTLQGKTGLAWRSDVTFTRPRRREEFFGRVKADLMVQIIEENDVAPESIYSMGGGDDPALAAAWAASGQSPGASAQRMRSTAAEQEQGSYAEYAKPYLLLDMRDAEEFEQFRMRGAVSYPTALLTRSTNPFNALVLSYVNHASNIIIVYCNDEKEGIAAAAKLSEKGCDNCFLLSGGLSHFASKHPTYLTGMVPAAYASSAVPPPTANSSRPSVSSRGRPASRGAPKPSGRRYGAAAPAAVTKITYRGGAGGAQRGTF